MESKEIKILKERYHLTAEELSELSGVPLGTLKKIFSGATEMPRKKTVSAISKVFEDLSRKSRDDSGYAHMLSFGLPDKVQGTYTVGDLESVPEGRYAELIDGAIYDMSVQSSVHEMVLGEIRRQFEDYIHDSGLPYYVFQSGIAVYSDSDDRNLLIPDLVILSDSAKLKEKGIYGAPDFVLEVLSPATSEKDQSIKAMKYHQLGVREYWMVDIQSKLVTTLKYNSGETKISGFEGALPVDIFNGVFSVNFDSVKKALAL